MRECDFCGKAFEEENGHQIFCSDYCRIQQRLLKKRVRRKEKQDLRGYKPRRSHLEWTDEDVQNRLDTKSSKIIYIGGYSGADNPMYIYCDDCGQPFKWSARGLRKHGSIQCDNCLQILSNIKEQEHQEQLEENKRIQHEQTLQRQYERKIIKIESRKRICQRCGIEFNGSRKYCSDKCRIRQLNSNHEHLRRIRINNNYHDNISIEILAKRDNNKCWLCGKAVDWNDCYRKKNNVFVAKGNYPSIDHVVALSNGGTHTWDNVRLAHKKCNTHKSNKVFGERKGQLILFC